MKLVDYHKLIQSLKRKKINYLEVEQKYFEKCFKIFESTNGEQEKLILISKIEGIASAIIRMHAKEYAKTNLGYSEEDWNSKYPTSLKIEILQKRKKDIFPCEINNLLIDLIVEEDQTKIIEIFINTCFDLDMGILKNRIFSFVISYFPTEKDYLLDVLITKVNIYKNYEREQINLIKEQQEEFEQKLIQEQEKNFYLNGKSVLKLFITEEFENKKQYCDNNKIEYEYFEKIIELSKKYDVETYKKYEEKIINQRNKRFNSILEIIEKIIYYLKNGIKCKNGIIREFDIIDYHMITKINFSELLKIIKESDRKFTASDLRIFQKFIQKYKAASKNNLNEITQILNHKNIETIGKRTINYSEREMIINFLKENNIPQNIITYRCCRNRYLNNILEIKENPKTKIRKLTSKKQIY